MTEDQFYEIWNRACMENGGAEPLKGDVALTKMLLGHGYIMNGGLEHFKDLTEEEQRDAIDGYRYFSFNEVVGLILKAPGLSGPDFDNAQNAMAEFDARMIAEVRTYVEHQFRVP